MQFHSAFAFLAILWQCALGFCDTHGSLDSFALSARSDSSSSHVHMPLKRQRVSRTAGTSRMKRWAREPVAEIEDGVAYLALISIGTPRMYVWVIIDTGSVELVLNPNCTNSADAYLCVMCGYYDWKISSTSKALGSPFSIQYGSGDAQGHYYSDTVYIGDWPLVKTQVAVASSSSYLTSGVFGLSYGKGYDTSYPTVLDQLVSQGHIQTPIFSIGVGAHDSSDSPGQILFGGIDLAKFSGRMQPLHLSSTPKQQMATYGSVRYLVNITSLGVQQPGQATKTLTDQSFSRTMIVDTGSSFSYIDGDLFTEIVKMFGASADSVGTYWVSCDWKNKAGTILFGFNHGGVTIHLPYSEFIVEFASDACALGFQKADAGVNTWVLGDTFIKAAYMVFDQANSIIWVADYKDCGSHIVDLTKGMAADLTNSVLGVC